MLATAKESNARNVKSPYCFACKLAFDDENGKTSFFAFCYCIVVTIGKNICLDFFQLCFMTLLVFVDGWEILPNLFAA